MGLHHWPNSKLWVLFSIKYNLSLMLIRNLVQKNFHLKKSTKVWHKNLSFSKTINSYLIFLGQWQGLILDNLLSSKNSLMSSKSLFLIFLTIIHFDKAWTTQNFFLKMTKDLSTPICLCKVIVLVTKTQMNCVIL